MTSTNDNLNDCSEFTLASADATASPSSLIISRPSVLREFQDLNESGETKVDVTRYVHALRRKWLLGLILGLLLAAPLAFAAWTMIPLEYTAVELVRISPNTTSLVFDSAEPLRAGDFKSFKNTQRQFMIQPFALNQAIKASGFDKIPAFSSISDPIGWLQKELDVSFPDQAEIMYVKLKYTDPIAAHKIVKAVVDTYMHDVVLKEKTERIERIEKLEKISKETEKRIRDKRDELSKLVSTLGMSDKTTVDLSQQLTLQQFNQVRTHLAKTNFEIMNLESELEVRAKLKKLASDAQIPVNSSTVEEARSSPTTKVEVATNGGATVNPEPVVSLPSEVKDPKLEMLLESDQQVQKLIKDIERFQKLIENAPKRFDAKKAAELLAMYQSSLSEAQAKLAERTKRLEQRLVGTESFGVDETDVLKAKIGVSKKQQDLLREEMTGLMAESKKFGRSSIDVELLRKEIEALEPMVAKVNQQLERTKIEDQSTSRIIPLASNGPPTVGASKLRLPVTAAAGLLGLFGPLVLLVMFDSLKNRVNNAASMTNGTQISILGSIPQVPPKFMKRLNDSTNAGAQVWRERIAESVAGVTAMLLRRLAVEGHRVVMIASATSGEGKTTLAELLARSLAETGHKTLLVDFDLRKPDLHRRCNVPLQPGVGEVLRSGLDLRQAVHITSSPNLHILPCGNFPGNLMLEAANGTLDNFFKECRSEYEIVIVDSSPLLPVVDGRLIGQFVDGAIMSVIKDTSQLSKVQSARAIMTDFGVAVLGCVVSGDIPGGYYNSYGYGSTKGNEGTVSRGVAATRSISAM